MIHEIEGQTYVSCFVKGRVCITPINLYLLFVDRTTTLEGLEWELLNYKEEQKEKKKGKAKAA